MATDRLRDRERLQLWPLIFIHIAVICYSLVQVAAFRNPAAFDPARFHILFDAAQLPLALVTVAAFAPVALLFIMARFSFGYFAGFFLYTVALSYLWLHSFSDLNYDHQLAGISVAVSTIAFLVPALFMTAPARAAYRLSESGFDRLLLVILVIGAATLATAAAYHLRLVSVSDIHQFRDQAELPKPVSYLIGMTSSALLPFAFAGSMFRRRYWTAAVALLLLLSFYPVTPTRLALFAPFWIGAMLVLSMLFRGRTAVVLSLLLPMSVTLAASALFPEMAAQLLAAVRMIAIPAAAIDVYSDFFSTHELAGFCQISFLRPLLECPYQDPLALVMQQAYGLGNLHASLLATEGIASVGFYLAPVAMLACGLVVGIGNRLSAGLPAPFVLVSAALLPQALISMPLSAVLLAHGAGLLFLLWYVTPRTIFAKESEAAIDARWRSALQGVARNFSPRAVVARLSGLGERGVLPIVLACHVVICCISLAILASFHFELHIFFDPARLPAAILVVLAFGALAWLFAVAPFSVGYLVGFGFYTMVLGYLWLNLFSDMNYDHRLAGLSAAASAIAFLVPALFITAPLRQAAAIPPAIFDKLLTAMLVIGALTVAVGSLYNFRIVSLADIYEFRGGLTYPLLLRYGLGITSGALLPFAFGCFVLLRSWWRAAIALAILLLFYPLTLSKLAFFAPAWLIAMAVVSTLLTVRLTVVTLLLAPTLLGVILIALFPTLALPYFDLVNFRLMAVPSNAMDFYNDFFSRNELTWFCQITFLKPLMNCPYREQLSAVMASTYGAGFTNASLFATEGIASVGTLLAPIPVFICGLVIALANRMSAGLPPRLVLISGAVVAQILLNVPLTTTLLSHGAALLFLLWYLAPRAMFEAAPPAIDAPGRAN